MKTLSTIFQFFPHVLSAVVSVEQNVQAPGATKKQIIIDSIQSVAQVAEGVPNPMVQMISAMIDALVGTLKATGVFGTSPTTTTVIGTPVVAPAVPVAVPPAH